MKLVFQSGPRSGQERRIEPGQAIILGRDEDIDVPLDDSRVSRRHARLRVDPNGTAKQIWSTTELWDFGVKIADRPRLLQLLTIHS